MMMMCACSLQSRQMSVLPAIQAMMMSVLPAVQAMMMSMLPAVQAMMMMMMCACFLQSRQMSVLPAMHERFTHDCSPCTPGRFTTVRLRGKRPSCVACGSEAAICASNLPAYDYVAFTGDDAIRVDDVITNRAYLCLFL